MQDQKHKQQMSITVSCPASTQNNALMQSELTNNALMQSELTNKIHGTRLFPLHEDLTVEDITSEDQHLKGRKRSTSGIYTFPINGNANKKANQLYRKIEEIAEENQQIQKDILTILPKYELLFTKDQNEEFRDQTVGQLIQEKNHIIDKLTFLAQNRNKMLIVSKKQNLQFINKITQSSKNSQQLEKKCIGLYQTIRKLQLDIKSIDLKYNGQINAMKESLKVKVQEIQEKDFILKRNMQQFELKQMDLKKELQNIKLLTSDNQNLFKQQIILYKSSYENLQTVNQELQNNFNNLEAEKEKKNKQSGLNEEQYIADIEKLQNDQILLKKNLFETKTKCKEFQILLLEEEQKYQLKLDQQNTKFAQSQIKHQTLLQKYSALENDKEQEKNKLYQQNQQIFQEKQAIIKALSLEISQIKQQLNLFKGQKQQILRQNSQEHEILLQRYATLESEKLVNEKMLEELKGQINEEILKFSIFQNNSKEQLSVTRLNLDKIIKEKDLLIIQRQIQKKIISQNCETLKQEIQSMKFQQSNSQEVFTKMKRNNSQTIYQKQNLKQQRQRLLSENQVFQQNLLKKQEIIETLSLEINQVHQKFELLKTQHQQIKLAQQNSTLQQKLKNDKELQQKYNILRIQIQQYERKQQKYIERYAEAESKINSVIEINKKLITQLQKQIEIKQSQIVQKLLQIALLNKSIEQYKQQSQRKFQILTLENIKRNQNNETQKRQAFLKITSMLGIIHALQLKNKQYEVKNKQYEVKNKQYEERNEKIIQQKQELINTNLKRYKQIETLRSNKEKLDSQVLTLFQENERLLKAQQNAELRQIIENDSSIKVSPINVITLIQNIEEYFSSTLKFKVQEFSEEDLEENVKLLEESSNFVQFLKQQIDLYEPISNKRANQTLCNNEQQFMELMEKIQQNQPNNSQEQSTIEPFLSSVNESLQKYKKDKGIIQYFKNMKEYNRQFNKHIKSHLMGNDEGDAFIHKTLLSDYIQYKEIHQSKDYTKVKDIKQHALRFLYLYSSFLELFFKHQIKALWRNTIYLIIQKVFSEEPFNAQEFTKIIQPDKVKISQKYLNLNLFSTEETIKAYKKNKYLSFYCCNQYCLSFEQQKFKNQMEGFQNNIHQERLMNKNSLDNAMLYSPIKKLEESNMKMTESLNDLIEKSAFQKQSEKEMHFKQISRQLEDIKKQLNQQHMSYINALLNSKEIHYNEVAIKQLDAMKENKIALVMSKLLKENAAIKKCLDLMLKNQALQTEKNNEAVFEEYQLSDQERRKSEISSSDQGDPELRTSREFSNTNNLDKSTSFESQREANKSEGKGGKEECEIY